MNNLTLNEIIKLSNDNKFLIGENIPGNAADYDDGWEDKADVHAVCDLLDLILYLSGTKNLIKGCDEKLGPSKDNSKSMLKKLVKIFNNDISIFNTKDNKENHYVLYGKINLWTSYELRSMIDNYIEQDSKILKNTKNL